MARRIRLCLFTITAVVPIQGALSQSGSLRGAWLEEGLFCADVFVATRNAVGFKRPASAFAPAILASMSDGGIHRYRAADRGGATKYQRRGTEDL